MSEKLKGQFKVQDWNEDEIERLGPAGRVCRATISQKYEGDLKGEGKIEYLMGYSDQHHANFVGIERLKASIDGREGSLALQITGTYDGERAQGKSKVIPGTGTDGLEGLRGSGEFEAPRGDTGSYTMNFYFE